MLRSRACLSHLHLDTLRPPCCGGSSPAELHQKGSFSSELSKNERSAQRGSFSWWTFRIFFSARGGGRGSPRRQERGGGGGNGFLLKIAGRGGSRRGRGRGAGRVELGKFWGGGGSILFGAETSTKFWDGYPADIGGSFARPKTSVRALKILEKQAFGRGHP